jgi:protein ImuA
MPTSLLWATREALLCADVAAVLAWPPDIRRHLRHLDCRARHGKLLFGNLLTGAA